MSLQFPQHILSSPINKCSQEPFRPATLLKKRLWHWCFPVNFIKFVRTPLYIERLWWLLLTIVLTYCLANICHDEDVLKKSWSRRKCSPNAYVFRRRLQDVSIKTNIIVLVIRLQDVFKTFSRHLAKTSSKRLQDVLRNVFETSSRRFQDVFKTYSRRFEDVFNASCKDPFKTFSRRIIKLNCSC